MFNNDDSNRDILWIYRDTNGLRGIGLGLGLGGCGLRRYPSLRTAPFEALDFCSAPYFGDCMKYIRYVSVCGKPKMKMQMETKTKTKRRRRRRRMRMMMIVNNSHSDHY